MRGSRLIFIGLPLAAVGAGAGIDTACRAPHKCAMTYLIQRNRRPDARAFARLR